MDLTVYQGHKNKRIKKYDVIDQSIEQHLHLSVLKHSRSMWDGKPWNPMKAITKHIKQPIKALRFRSGPFFMGDTFLS